MHGCPAFRFYMVHIGVVIEEDLKSLTRSLPCGNKHGRLAVVVGLIYVAAALN